MKARRVWIGAGIVTLLAALGVWIASHTYWERATERGFPDLQVFSDPLYMQHRLATELGATVDTGVPSDGLPARNAVLMLYRWSWSASAPRNAALRRWVEQGGSLVVDRSTGYSSQFDEWSGVKLHDLEGVDLRAARERGDANSGSGADTGDNDKDRACQLLRPRVQPAGMHVPPGGWRMCYGPNDSYFESPARAELVLADEAGPQLVRVKIGAGTVTLLNAHAFDYFTLLRADNPQVFALATHLGRGSLLHFLRGDVAGETLLQLLWRHAGGALLLLLAAALCAAWRASVRFGPLLPAPQPARRSLRAQLSGTGQFLQRYGGARSLWEATRRALEAAAARHMPRSQVLDPAQRAERIAALAQTDARLLVPLLDPQHTPDPRALPQALALLETARRRLLYSKIHGSPNTKGSA